MAVEARSVQVASAPVSSYDTQITHKRRCRRCGNGGRLSKFDGRRGRSSTKQSQHGKKAPPSWKIQRLSARVCAWHLGALGEDLARAIYVVLHPSGQMAFLTRITSRMPLMILLSRVRPCPRAIR